MAEQAYKQIDVLVIGGGINGAGVARDVAGRGLSVVLCEKDDLASATSSASTKLIHGGLRYLEHRAFRLVREALREREVLLKSAPHIIWPLTFVLPHDAKMRARWMIRLGLFLYDHLGGLKMLPKSQAHLLAGTLLGQPLKRDYKRGFTYADCWAEDTRLVVLNAVGAREKGAEILTRTECVHIARHPEESGWIVTLLDHITDTQSQIHARMIVNASGPWVNKTLGLVGRDFARHAVRWVKGSHLIVPRLYSGEHAYILQNTDKRIVFVIPYEKKYSLIGTTDVDYEGDIEEIRIDLKEVEYLCTAISRCFRQKISPEDVLWTYSGVRPLVGDAGSGKASAITREYFLDLADVDGAPILSIYGGKLTSFRALSEQVGNKVVKALGQGLGAWTEKAALPGGEGIANFEAFFKTVRREFNWLPESLALRYARAYGARIRDMLLGFKRMADMGEFFGDDVYEAEIRYLLHAEWAMTMDDILWRRSKLGLHISAETEKKIKAFLKQMMRHAMTDSGISRDH